MNLAQITFLLGWVNIIGIVLVFFSCRCLMGPKIFSWLQRIPGYLAFYKTHCYWWWLFFASVLGHVILAFMAFGNPF